ncbi:MAG: TMEM43 family protein [Candidatus Eremiobacteraeota bacterium]|nr:TMEM43 family protein [Candidatus Eremiobacteraeota bacterium]
MATTEVSSQGWLSRLMESIGGVLFGIVLFLIAFPVLYWNEGRAVRTARGLAEGKSAVISVSADKVDPANEGKLIHLSGQATAEGTLRDDQFPVEVANALQLRRVVEVYQWEQQEKREKRKKLGGGEETVTTYTYHETWSEQLIDSSQFKEHGYDNPRNKPYESANWVAKDATVGAFKLTSLTDDVNAWVEIPFDKSPPGRLQVDHGELYLGANPARPVVGDTRIRFEAVKPTQVSIVAVQQSDSFSPYKSETGTTVFRLVVGQQSAEQMFEKMEAENNMMTWVLRGVGFVMMLIGVGMVFRPLVVVADVVPLFGSLLEVGVGLVALAIAVPCALAAIALGWIAYRPVVGIGLLVGAVAVFGGAFMMARGKR